VDSRGQTTPLGPAHAVVGRQPSDAQRAFFKRMDAIVAAAQQNHQLLLIGVYHSDDVSARRVTSANVGGWTRWLANRYKNAPNIIWSMYSAPEASSIPMVQAAVRGLREGDGGAHLITLHPEGVAGSSSFMHGELSLNTFQSLSGGHLNYELAQADFIRTPPRPVVNGEALYEGDPRRRSGCGALSGRRLDSGLFLHERDRDCQVAFRHLIEKSIGFVDQSARWRQGESWSLFQFRASGFHAAPRLARCRAAGARGALISGVSWISGAGAKGAPFGRLKSQENWSSSALRPLIFPCPRR
jgi:hypothetical protein